jgi:CheY-like chemotaxis protein
MMLADEILVNLLQKNGGLTDRDLRNAAERQRNQEQPETLEACLMFLGLVDYARLGEVYAEHFRLPYHPVFHQGFSPELARRLTSPVVERLRVLPLAIDDARLTVVVADPRQQVALEEVRQRLQAQSIVCRVASAVEIEDAIQRHLYQRPVSREHRGIELPFDFKIIDYSFEPESVGDESRSNRPMDAASRGRVIIVEPDHEVRQALAVLLGREGYAVTTVVDEGEAVRQLVRQPADYILERRSFRSRSQEELSAYIETTAERPDIRYYGSLGGSLLGDELASEQIFRSFLGVVRLLLEILAAGNSSVLENCRQLTQYARLLGASIGLSRRELQATLLAAYLKEISRFAHAGGGGDRNEMFTIIPMLPYDDSAALLRDLDDGYDLAAVIAGINQPVATKPPLAARVLTLLLAFMAIRHRQPQITRQPAGLRQALEDEKPGLLDAKLMDQLVQLVAHENRLAESSAAGRTILVIDPVFERDQQALYQRLITAGYNIEYAPRADQALARIGQGDIQVVLSEVAFAGYDGLEFCRRLTTGTTGVAADNLPPFIFLTAQPVDDRLQAQAIRAGAEDVWSRDAGAEVTVLRLDRLVERRWRMTGDGGRNAGGVSGSLADMGFMETVQILANSGRDVQIELKDAVHGGTGEVCIHRGEIVYAVSGHLTGEEAVYDLITWREGTFRVSALKTVPERNVTGSTEAIMLEGCRLMDEESRDAWL